MEDVFMKVLVIVTTLISTCISSNAYIKYFDKAIQNIALNKKNIYIGAVNSIWKLDYNLTLLIERSTGPKEDDPIYCFFKQDSRLDRLSIDCLKTDVKEKLKKVNNYNQILLITDGLNKLGSLLSCGTLKQGICEYLSLDTLKNENTNKDLEESLLNYYVGANIRNASTIAVTSKDGEKLYVARTMTYYNSLFQSNMMHSIAKRTLLHNGALQNLKILDKINCNKDLFHKIDGDDSTYFYASSYHIYYTSAYTFGLNLYFTTIQRRNVSSGEIFVSKLVRITPGNYKTFKTYVETMLACKDNGIDYNLLLSVSIIDITDTYPHLPYLKKGDQIIFGVFARSDVYKEYPHKYKKYAICQFSLNSINQRFKSIIESCEAGPNEKEKKKRKKVPKAPWIESKECGHIGNELVSYAPNITIYGNVLHTEDNKFQAIYSYAHSRGVSLFVSSNGHSLLKFAVLNETGTKKLHLYSKKEFPDDGKDQSMFFKMELDATKKTLFLISKNHVAKVPVVDCNSRNSCVDCLMGPSCGWCSLIDRCTLRNDCPNNEKPLYFVDKSINACPTSTIKDSNFSVGVYKKISIVTKNVPDDITTYKCKIGSVVIPLTKDGVTFTCDQIDFKDISTFNETIGEGTISVSIVSNVSGKYYPVVTSTITIYRCSSYKTCDKCLTGKYHCGWCSNQMTCSNAPGTCTQWIPYKGYGSNESSQICPMLLNTPNTYLPSGMERLVILNGKRFPQPSGAKSYKCILKVSGAEIATNAEWKNSTQLSCNKKMYSYPDNNKDSVKGIFTVSYGEGFIDTSTIKVVLYKCSWKRHCSVCMNATTGWDCGWCGKPQECRLKETCGSSTPVSRCPNPVIKMFKPSKASVNSTTEVVIKGSDLGSRGDLRSVIIAGQECKHVMEKHVESEQITCTLQPSKTVRSGYINVSLSSNRESTFAISKKKFYFVKPKVLTFEPKTGPCSGGTTLTIKGNDLDAGNNVKVFVGSEKCKITGVRYSHNFMCKTKSAANASECMSRKRRDTSKPLFVCVGFEGNRVCSSEGFQYQLDPLITSVYTNKALILISTFFSGGQVFIIQGQRLDIIQNPKIIFKTIGVGNESKSFESSCGFRGISRAKMTCLAPNISSAFTGNKTETTVQLGFKMANVVTLLNYRNIKVVADPVFHPFHPNNEKLHDFKNLDLMIRGSGLSVLNRKDVEVTIGGVPCTNVGLVGVDDRLICTMPSKKVLDKEVPGGSYDVKVIVGEGGLEYDVGFVKYKVVKKNNYTLYLSLAAAAGVLIILIVIVSVCFLYRRRHLRDKKDYHKDLQLHMDKIESQYARECKEAFAEYQIERSDLTSEVEQETAPCREFRQFAMRVLYPGLDSHPILEENKDDRAEWERCMQSFIELLKNKDFILTFVRTLESQSTFQMTDRCIVASLLMVSLQDDIVFVTDILKELLTDLINKAGSGKRPKLLLRRTESIAEKLLTNWLAYTLFDFLSDVVGEPLFKLFTAVNILLDKEPADAITFDAKNSLSEDKLLRTKIDFRILLINIEYVHPKFGGNYEGVPVLSTDTITQCKEKVLKNIYKNQPHSMRPLPDDLQLGHVGPSGAIRYMQDCDASNLIEGEWKKLNTLGYVLSLHKIPECSCLRLSHFTEALSANGSAMMDDSLPNVTFHSSISSTPMLYDCGSLEPKLYHLVKPSDSDFAKDDVRQSKMMAEVYLTRLLKTKETLLSFVNQLFQSIFGLSEHDRVIPPSIKFLFDFLDSQAEKMDIEDSDVHHTWKNNSLPLRFWINIIKNPDFVFDIRKSNTVDSCLSVIAQLFMDSCSPDEHRLGKDSPSNKLLYAKEIPGYKKEVKRFYKDVKDARFDEKEFYRRLAEISSLYGKSFNSCNAAYELMSYAVLYKVKLMDNLEDNNSAEDAEKLQEIMENLPDD